MRRSLLCIAVVLIALTRSVSAVGSVTATVTDVGGGVTQYSLAWVSDASGNVNANLTAIKRGVVVGVKFKPDGGGTAPTDLYDVLFEDVDNVDLLMGGGANLSGTLSLRKKPALNTSDEVFFEGSASCELNISNAGNAKGGTVILWIRG